MRYASLQCLLSCVSTSNQIILFVCVHSQYSVWYDMITIYNTIWLFIMCTQSAGGLNLRSGPSRGGRDVEACLREGTLRVSCSKDNVLLLIIQLLLLSPVALLLAGVPCALDTPVRPANGWTDQGQSQTCSNCSPEQGRQFHGVAILGWRKIYLCLKYFLPLLWNYSKLFTVTVPRTDKDDMSHIISVRSGLIISRTVVVLRIRLDVLTASTLRQHTIDTLIIITGIRLVKF